MYYKNATCNATLDNYFLFNFVDVYCLLPAGHDESCPFGKLCHVIYDVMFPNRAMFSIELITQCITLWTKIFDTSRIKPYLYISYRIDSNDSLVSSITDFIQPDPQVTYRNISHLQMWVNMFFVIQLFLDNCLKSKTCIGMALTFPRTYISIAICCYSNIIINNHKR